ncbi:TPA: hypothetical protein ACH3X2_010134 [Trebouxia sp. C0005]
MDEGNSEDSFVMEDIAYEDNDFEEDVQTALVHTDKVSHDRVPSARSSARSMHDSYTPMDSPIPGERQVFLRPSEQEFVQGSYLNGGLPPLPEFPAYNGNPMQSGTANPLYGEESAADDVAEPEPDQSQAFGQSYAAPADYQHADEQYSHQHSSAYAQPTVTDYTAAAATQLGLDHPVQGAADRGIVDSDCSHERYSADQSHGLEQHIEEVNSQPVPSMLTVPRQSSELVSGSGHAHQLSTYDATSLHGVSGQAASRSWSARCSAEQPADASHSARSTIDIASPSPVTPGGVDNIHNFDHPGHPSFTPAYPPASHSQAGAVSQSGRPQSASSVQPVLRQNSSGHSSNHPVQYMQPAPVHAVYEEDDYQEPTARGGKPGSSRGGYQQPEEDYRGKHAARSSRPGSARTRQRGQRIDSQGQTPRPYSPARDGHYDIELASSSIPAYHPSEPPHPSPRSPRSRPGSAMARARLEAAVQQSMQHNVDQWAVAQVCDWSDYIGLGQYRKKFVHHCIDGRLLLRLSDRDLKEEMGIAPLGHRQGLLMAIADLATYNSQTHGGSPPHRPQSRGRPQSAPGARGYSPARGAASDGGSVCPERGLKELHALKALELRDHLLHEMEKAQYRAAHRQSLAGQAVHHAQIAGTETKKLKGQIFDLERKAGLRPLIRPSSGMSQCMGDSLDVPGHIPWHPAGRGRSTTPLCKASPEMTNEVTFHPHINQHSLVIMQERRGGNGSASFLNRLEADLHGRKMRLQNKAEQLHSKEAVFGDPKIAQKEADRDAHFLRQYVQLKTGQDLPREGIETALDEVLTSYKSELGLTDKETNQLEHFQGNAKVQRVVAILRGHQFMERYQAEINARDERMKESKRLGREVPKKTRMTAPEVKSNTDELDIKKCAAHFETCGWDSLEFDPSSGGPDKKFDGVLKRVRAQQEAQDKASAALQASKAATVAMLIPDAKVDWSKFRSDGLESLQESQMKKQQAAQAGKKEEDSKPARHNLNWTVQLLAACRKDELDKLEKWQGVPRCVAMYRAINSQRFLEFTREDLRKREEKHEQAMKALEPHRKQLSKQDADKFFDRLMDDTEKRKKNRADMIKKAREAEERKIADFLATQKHLSQKHRQPHRAH